VVYDVRPVATAREGTQPETQFSLDRDRRQRLLKGDTRAFVFTGDKEDRKPYGCQPGATYVLSWSRPQYSREQGQRVEVPRQATHYIVVTDVRRHRKGGWMVRFDVVDNRERVRYLRRTPPVMDPDAKDDGNLESSYTTSRWQAIDDLECIPTAWQERMSREAFERDDDARRQQAETRMKQRRQTKRQRKVSTAIEMAA